MTVETEISTAETETANSEVTTETASTEKATPENPNPAPDEKTEEKIDLGKTDPDNKDPDKANPNPEKDEVDARYGAPADDAAYEITGLPEGMTVDAEALEMVAPALRELNLSNEGASKLMGVYAEKVLPHVEKQVIAAVESNIVKQRTEWEGAARDLISGKAEDGSALVAKNAAGEVLGFDGKDMKGVSAIAARALDRLAPEGFRQFLDDTGLGVHPQMVAFAYQAGKAIAEDREIETGTVAAKPVERVDKYYPPKKD